MEPKNKNTYLTLDARKKIYLQSKAIEYVENGIIITDCSGFIIYANPYVYNLTGYTQEEVIGKTPRIFKSGIHTDAFYKDLWDTITSGRKWKGEITNKKKNGNLWVEFLTITPIKDDNGEIEFYVGIQQDTEKNADRNKSELNIKTSLTELNDFIKSKNQENSHSGTKQ